VKIASLVRVNQEAHLAHLAADSNQGGDDGRIRIVFAV
jgi:hypothetical protein